MENEAVVFVRGTGRCGTKSLVRHLGQHPRIAQVPVNEVLPEELIDWTRARLQRVHPEVTDAVVAAACRAYLSAYGRALAGEGEILLQKSTMHAHHLGTLLAFWPEARILYLVRHPIKVVESLINVDIADFRGGYGYDAGVADSLLRWHNDLLAYLRSPAFGHPRVRQVQFESLVRDPQRVVDDICRFLGVGVVALPELPGPERYAVPFVLNADERRWILESTRDVVQQLGYDPDAWDDAVPSDRAALVDRYPERRLKAVPPTLDGVALVTQALARAADDGHTRVGLFGAGYCARLVCPHLQDLPVEVPCIFDDNPSLANVRIGRLPVCGTEAALEMGIDAVIPITFVHQARMIRRWRRVVGEHVPILPLWNEATVAV